ncbi:MAG TPA: cytochrome c biogenesis protein CcsA [Pelomicrobium sp.]|nr:cytochrome c biogenesis protein CcsA [Pelomicrobium sp.]
MSGELPLLWMAAACYAAAAAVAFTRAFAHPLFGMLLTAGIVLHTGSLASRWLLLGYGPFTNLHEILSSNVWSLSLIFAAAWWRMPAVRPAARMVMPVLLMMTAWLMTTDAAPGYFPPTYLALLLYLHTLVGKLFLGLLLVAAGLGGVILLHRRRPLAWAPVLIPGEARLGELAYRFAAIAFLFQSAMLVVGAVWAQDAWGRYWAWDPLETWAFVTWIALGFTLHARNGGRSGEPLVAGLIIAVFTIAFLTFFGVPFLSMAPHKGAF